MGFQKGSAAMAAAATSEKSRGKRGGGRTTYFSLQDGERVLLRFLTDLDPHEVNGQPVGGAIVVRQHPATPTRPKPAAYKGERWPSMLSPVCRRELGEPCYICDNEVKNDRGKPILPMSRIFAYAAMREIIQEDGRTVGVRDVTHEVERDGVMVTEPVVVVVNQPDRTFFGSMKDAGSVYGTWLDRDYVVTRMGSGLETRYGITPVDAAVSPGYDLRNPETAALYGAGDYCPDEERRHPVLDDFVADLASDEYYRRWIVPNPSPDPWDESANSSAPVAKGASAPSNDVDPAALADLAAKLAPHSAAGQ
jgi:hypothetical protein